MIRSIFLFLALGIFPPLAGAFMNASSMALGMLIGLSLFPLFFFKNISFLSKIPKFFFYFLLVIIFHSVLLHIQFTFFEVKSYASFFILGYLLFISFFLSKIIIFNLFEISDSVKYIFFILLFFSIIAFLTNFNLGKIYYDRNKTIFPFGEPSHFALFFGPFFLLYLLKLRDTTYRLLIILSIAFLAILIESTTLILYVALSLILLIRLNIIGIFIIIPIFAFGILYVINDPYFFSRFNLSSQSDNLTALVYIQGLTDAYYALVDTYGLGLGFQMLGTQPPSEISYQIQILNGQGFRDEGLNRQDGGFVAAKIVAEFGLLGIVVLLSYLTLFLKVFFKLRLFVQKLIKLDSIQLFSYVFIYAIFIELFVRGVGYFSPSLFLFFTALFVYHYGKKNYFGSYNY